MLADNTLSGLMALLRPAVLRALATSVARAGLAFQELTLFA